MNTKTLLLLGALGAAGMTSAVAQTNVYSVNAVGYVNVPLPTGFSLIANQLNSTNNTIGSLLAGLPNFSNFYKFTPGSGFDIATLVFGAWDKPAITLNPGEGGFVNVGSASSVTFVGDVPQGNLTNTALAGFSIRSSMVPQAGRIDTLGLASALSNFDNLYKWNGNGYDIYTLTFGSWSLNGSPSGVPTVAVGEAFFLNLNNPISWVRSFSVNN